MNTCSTADLDTPDMLLIARAMELSRPRNPEKHRNYLQTLPPFRLRERVALLEADAQRPYTYRGGRL